ncbi:hypothetical protein PINS_up014626 [Pythium insidiosum]|nr:hypothetical protein PINS_up014626 [Pythium insidiosum]
MERKTSVRLLLHGGDSMLGRAVQLTFPNQAVDEERLSDTTTALNYLSLALHRSRDALLDGAALARIREANVDGSYLWGDFFEQLEIVPPPDARILNLETAVTETVSNKDVPNKGINYHFHVKNIPLAFRRFAAVTLQGASGGLEMARHLVPYVVSMANNHAMDFGRRAFDRETLPARSMFPGDSHLIGIGETLRQARQSVAHVSVPGCQRGITVVAVTAECAGTPYDWNATSNRSGMICLPAITSPSAIDACVHMLKELFEANRILSPVERTRDDDLLVLSIHWGPNWAFRYTDDLDYQRCRQLLAHRIVRDLGVDLIYGHSSHHIRGLELFDGKLIIYGAGDLVNDYEGFENPGDDAYCKLGALFVVDLDVDTANCRALRLVPTTMFELRLRRVSNSPTPRWRPRQQRVELETDMATTLCQAINKYSRMDVGDHGTPLQLRVVDEDACVPGGSILMYP